MQSKYVTDLKVYEKKISKTKPTTSRPISHNQLDKPYMTGTLGLAHGQPAHWPIRVSFLR